MEAVVADGLSASRPYLSRLEMGRPDPPLSRVVTRAKALRVKFGALVD